MENKLAVIVIPVYNPVPSRYEQISIQQCLKVLGEYTIVFLSRPDFDNAWYQVQYGNHRAVQFLKLPYGPRDKGFDALMLSSSFYEHFLAYKYLLIYHTDAFVFRNELADWCKKNYDYIGATIFDTDFTKVFFQYSKYRFLLKLGLLKNTNIGNGGFSLRKVRSFYWSTRLYKPFIKSLTHGLNEDLFWSFKMPYLNPFFKVPDLERGKGFAFETSPEKVFALNNHQLPFGCHAWWRYGFEFWKPHIEAQGYQLITESVT